MVPNRKFREKVSLGEDKLREKGFPNVKVIAFIHEFLFFLVMKFIQFEFTQGLNDFT